MANKLSVFTKPWKDITTEQLGELVASLGFDAVEFPLRDGYQAQPADAEKSLPKLVETLKAYGITVESVASPKTKSFGHSLKLLKTKNTKTRC